MAIDNGSLIFFAFKNNPLFYKTPKYHTQNYFKNLLNQSDQMFGFDQPTISTTSDNGRPGHSPTMVPIWLLTKINIFSILEKYITVPELLFGGRG